MTILNMNNHVNNINKINIYLQINTSCFLLKRKKDLYKEYL